MKAKEIQELIDYIAKSGLDEVKIETDSFKISVRRNSMTVSADTPVLIPQNASNQVSQVVSTPSQEQAQAVSQPTPANANSNPQEGKDDKDLETIKSPMIGTFYRSSDPDSAPFVNIGDEVKKGQVVCIIEAMKLFNEIESEVSGKVVKVLVDNATPVEYDQAIFLVEPS